jgi:fermentation-respiration switch protein FrsA (DUF1100 family)
MDAPSTTVDPEPKPNLAAPATRPRRRGWRFWVVRIVRIPLLVYVGLLAVLFSFQTKIIFPGAETQGQREAVVEVKAGEQLVELKTARGEKVFALFGPALAPDGSTDPSAASRPTLLYFYGNAMCLRASNDEFERFRRLGLNVMIPEFVGYGMSDGKPSESGCYATADAAYEHLLKRQDIDPNKIIAAGWSLGGAVAIDLASRKPLAGLIAFSTFTSMVDMSRRNFPLIPASILLRHRFENARKISRVRCPILLGHGRNDQLIPYSMMEKLVTSAQAPVMRLSIDGAGHNDFYVVGGDKIYAAMRQFVEQLPEPGR